MNITRNLKHTFKYSLHDAKVNTIEVQGENLFLNFDYIFIYFHTMKRVSISTMLN